jgi:metal-responsive CopG/Arc/MetJ family transcriptional regulator
MRITIRLNDQLLKSAKRLAHDTGTSLTAVIEDALRQILSRRAVKQPRNPVRLTTVSGRGVHPGVVLHDSSALLDFMEQSHSSSF